MERVSGWVNGHWVSNLELLVQWCDAVQLFGCAAATDRARFTACRTAEIESEPLVHALGRWGPNLCLLPTWIDRGCEAIASDANVPRAFDVVAPGTAAHADAWRAFVLGEAGPGEADALDRLRQICIDAHATFGETLGKLRQMHRGCDDEHSSYSDYSTDDTESDEDEGEGEEEGDESSTEDTAEDTPPPRRYFRRRR